MTGYGGADRSYFWAGAAPYSEREINLEFAPGTLINKAAVNQASARDTIDAQVLAGMPYGRNPSEPSKPTLEFPMTQLRVANRPTTDKDNSEFLKQLQNLKGALPEDVLRQLEKTMQEPTLGRDPSYIALNNALYFGAMSLVWLNQMAKPFDPNGTAMRFADQNLHFIDKAMHHLMAQGERIIREGFLYLDSLGRGHINYDALFSFLKQIALTIKLLKTTSSKKERKRDQEEGEDERDQEEKGSKEESSKDALERISRLTETLNKEYFNKKNDKKFSMIGALLKGIETLNMTYSLEPPLRSILYGLITVHIGSDISESALGYLGKETKKVLDSFGEILANGVFYRIDSAEKILITFLISILNTSCLAAAAFLIHYEKESGSPSEENPFEEVKPTLSIEEEEFIRVCTLENFIRMACSMNLISNLLDENKIHPLIKQLRQNGKEMVSKSIELLLLVLILKLLGSYRKAFYLPLVESLSDLLIERFEAFELCLMAIKNEKMKELKIDRKGIVDIIHHLVGCKRSLEMQNFTDYDRSLDHFFESLGANGESLDEELKIFYNLAQTYRSVLRSESSELNEAQTGIFHI